MAGYWLFRRRMRTLAVLVACAVLLLGTGTWSAPASAAASITYTYSVQGKGNSTSLEEFAARAAETFAASQGWGLGGSIAFQRVASGGDFTLWLSAPHLVPTFSSGCSSEYSCRVGRNVIINEARFRGATATWNAAGGSLRDYQHMVVNHETGHWLGFGHASCPGAGQPAPVMQQQSKGLQGCRANPWPTATERGSLSRSRGVPIVTPPPPPPPGPPLLPAGTILTVPLAPAGIPANAEAVGVNVTVTEPAGRGFVTVFPCGGEPPPTSNLNFAAGQTLAAFTLAAPGAGGSVCVRTSQATHLIVDLSGYVPTGSSYQPVPPQRLLDSRSTGSRPAGTVPVALPAGAVGAALTVTVTEPIAPGFITVHPCGEAAPLASSVNFTAGQDIANLVLATAGPDGRVCLTPSVPTHLVVDIVGTFPAGAGFGGQSPQRLIDTRVAPIAAGVTEVAVPGGGLHSLNLTVTGPTGSGWARAFPCGSTEPSTSNINYAPGQTVANAFIAASGANGRICVRSSAPVHVIVDDGGTLAATDYQPVQAARLLDSRQR